MKRLAALVLLSGCGASPDDGPAGQDGRIQNAAAEIRNDAEAEVDREIKRMGPLPPVASTAPPQASGDATDDGDTDDG